MDGLDFWRLNEELTVVQAAVLFTGHNPAIYKNIENYSQEKEPDGYDAIKCAIMTAVGNKTIEGAILYEEPPNNEEAYPCPKLSFVNVESLKAWLLQRGVKNHIFYFPSDEEDEFLRQSHPRYSPKLAAAVRAWKTLNDEKLLRATTPKKAVQKWLRQHALEYGLCDDEGKPLESVIEGISKIVNWNPKGGAPSTPDQFTSNPTQLKNDKMAIKNDKMAVNEPTELLEGDYTPGYDPDGIPF